MPQDSVNGTDQRYSKPFNRELRDMLSAITSRIASLPKTAAGVRHVEDDYDDDDDKHGVRVITLAGSNTGATMRSDSNEVKPSAHNGLMSASEKAGDAGDALSTYVNSNFQAMNNSIMLDSSYSTNDPGVHLEISDDLPEKNKLAGKEVGGSTKEKHPIKASHDQYEEQSD